MIESEVKSEIIKNKSEMKERKLKEKEEKIKEEMRRKEHMPSECVLLKSLFINTTQRFHLTSLWPEASHKATLGQELKLECFFG